MEQGRDGYRQFLEIQVEALQEQLYALERDPEQVEYLKSILRVCQRLRHAREAEEPESVHILRNAVEKVTLHLGLATVSVSQDVLDFYVDTFDLLEEVVRRWPKGPAFDRARYADRVRALLQLEAGDVLPAPRPVAASVAERAEEELGPESPAEAPVEVELPGPSAAEAAGLAEETLPAETGMAAAAEMEPETGAAVRVLSARDVPDDERGLYVRVDLAELLAEPWARPPAAVEAPAAAPEVAAGGLAASYTILEALRAGAEVESPIGEPARSRPSPEAEAAFARLSDVLDAFSLSLTELDSASERLLAEDTHALGGSSLSSMVERLELEKGKLLGVFDRTIESFRAEGR